MMRGRDHAEDQRLLFGLNVPSAGGVDSDPLEDAVRAERLGFDFVPTNDHPNGTPSHEAWTRLTWIAARTSRIKVASRVLGAPYRPPPFVAKMAATLQGLSEGRLILGLGGGSSDEGLEAFGVGPLGRGLQAVAGVHATFGLLLLALAMGVSIARPHGVVLRALEIAGGALLVWLAYDGVRSEPQSGTGEFRPRLHPAVRGSLSIVLNPGG
jgi:hypothetical protein